MNFTLFSLVGGLVATGPGIVLISGLAASTVIFWNWRWALGGTVVILMGITSLQAAVHQPTFLVSTSQWLATLVAGALLGLAGYFQPHHASARSSTNWFVRMMALGFIAGAWWVIDPGFSLPNFSQVETDLLLWIGLCGMLMLGLSSSPLQSGIGLLLLTAPTQAMAPILLPGSGLAVILGIAQILLALACAYLTLVEPAPVARQRTVFSLLAPSVITPSVAAPTPPAQARRPALLPRGRATHPSSVPAATPEQSGRADNPIVAEESA